MKNANRLHIPVRISSNILSNFGVSNPSSIAQIYRSAWDIDNTYVLKTNDDKGQLDKSIMLTREELKAFDQDFPPKVPRPVVPIDVLLERLEPAARETIKNMNLPCLGELRGRTQREIASLPDIDGKAINTIRTVMKEYGRIWGEGG